MYIVTSHYIGNAPDVPDFLSIFLALCFLLELIMLAIRHRPSWNIIDQGKFVASVITIVDLFIEYGLLRISMSDSCIISPLYLGHSSCSQYQPERIFEEEG